MMTHREGVDDHQMEFFNPPILPSTWVNSPDSIIAIIETDAHHFPLGPVPRLLSIHPSQWRCNRLVVLQVKRRREATNETELNRNKNPFPFPPPNPLIQSQKCGCPVQFPLQEHAVQHDVTVWHGKTHQNGEGSSFRTHF